MRKILVLLFATSIVVIAAAQLELLPEYAAHWPAPFHNSFLKVQAWQWAGVGFVIVISAIAGLVIRGLFKRLTYLRDRMSGQPMDDVTRVFVSKAAGLFGAGVLAYALMPDLLLTHLARHLEGIAIGTSILGAVLLLYGWWDAVCDSLSAHAVGNRRTERLLIPVTRKIVHVLIVILGLLIALATFLGTKTLTGLVAGLGVGGVLFALAAKDSAENVLASITIVFDMPFAIGDWIKMDKVEGTVEEINLRSTRVRTAADTLITLPNANLIRSPVENFGVRRRRRQRVNLRLSFDCDPKQIDAYCDALREYLKAQELVVKDLTTVELDDPTETSIGVIAEWYLDTNSADEEAANRHAFLDEALRKKAELGLKFGAPAG